MGAEQIGNFLPHSQNPIPICCRCGAARAGPPCPSEPQSCPCETGSSLGILLLCRPLSPLPLHFPYLFPWAGSKQLVNNQPLLPIADVVVAP